MLRTPTGKRGAGGTVLKFIFGASEVGALVVMVSVEVAAATPLGATDDGENVQVAPVGQPPATVSVTVPVKSEIGVIERTAEPVAPGVEILMDEGLADTLKSATVTGTATEVDGA